MRACARLETAYTDPSNTNEPSHAVPSLVPAAASNPSVRMEGVFDSLKGRWQYWQTFNRPDFDEVKWNDPPPNASYNTEGGGPSPLAGEIDGFDDLFGTIKTSGKNVFVSAPELVTLKERFMYLHISQHWIFYIRF